MKESESEPEMDPALSTQHPALSTQHSALSTQSSVLSVFAVFDVDRTLIPVTTTERIFIGYLLRKRVLGVRSVFQTMLFIARNLRKTSPFEAIRRERAYLYGLRYDRIVRMAHDCFETDIKPRISRAGLAAIEEHKRQGHEIVLLSGSLDFLLKPFKEYVGADHLISANMEVAGGKLTGRIVGQYPYGGLKATLMQHFASEHGLDFTRSFAYADHHSDHEVLRLFGNPVVINPKKRMREIAEKEGWEVRSFS